MLVMSFFYFVIAHMYVLNNAAVLSNGWSKRYLRGRGRYGATPHPKTALLQFILQEREKPFTKRVADPLGNSFFSRFRMDS